MFPNVEWAIIVKLLTLWLRHNLVQGSIWARGPAGRGQTTDWWYFHVWDWVISSHKGWGRWKISLFKHIEYWTRATLSWKQMIWANLKMNDELRQLELCFKSGEIGGLMIKWKPIVGDEKFLRGHKLLVSPGVSLVYFDPIVSTS